MDEIKENSIVVVADAYKEKFIEDFRRRHSMFAVMVLGLDEFKKKYYFDYTSEAVFFVHEKLGVIKEVAQMYLRNLYFLKDGVTSTKVDFLRELKNDLDERGLLIYDVQFRKFLEGREVVLYALSEVDKFYTRMFDEVKSRTNVVTVCEKEGECTRKPLYRLANRDSEVAFVAARIADFLKRGVPIDNIKLANVGDDYHFALAKTFKEFHIPVELKSSATIAGTVLVSKFEEFYSDDMEEALKRLEPYVKGEQGEYIYGKILSVLNDYCWCKNYTDVKEFVLKDIRKIETKPVTYKHAVRTIDFVSQKISEDDYVFLLNFNQGAIPKSKKDEDYLPDETKVKLGLSDSIDINKRLVAAIRHKIATSKNLIVSYAARDLKGELYLSNAYDENLFESGQGEVSWEHSDDYNRRVLLSKMDEFKKYGTTSDELEILLNHYKDEPYGTFDNSFKGINKEALREFLEGKLTLSYSSMNDYYKCSFRYYLDYILRVDKFTDSFATVTGNIFHEVLSKCFDDGFEFERTWNGAIGHTEFEFGNMEKFYLGLLKEELVFIIENLKRQLEYTSLNKALYEQKITVPLDDEGNIIFKGFVDKILYDDEGEEKVAAIIDYKTGNPELNIDNLIYGLDMQLPVYAYLLKNFEPLKDASIGGFYLQKILNGAKDPEAKASALKLQGYSNANPRILERVDKTYEDSSLIKSMRTTKGNFYSYAKVLNDAQIEKMTTIVREKIGEAAKNIMEANFQIDPKEIGGANKGCEYCTYQDICYRKNKDIKKLDKKRKEDFLRGDEDGLD